MTPLERSKESSVGVSEAYAIARNRGDRCLSWKGQRSGRRQLLTTLQQELAAGTARLIAQPIGVQAEGGVDKTALVTELGWRLFRSEVV